MDVDTGVDAMVYASMWIASLGFLFWISLSE
jgi:hypothetical protein